MYIWGVASQESKQDGPGGDFWGRLELGDEGRREAGSQSASRRDNLGRGGAYCAPG